MPALPSRIAFITEQYRRVVAETPDVVTRHGNLARQSDDPIGTYFDNTADAETIAEERQALLSPERRRFKVVVRDPGEIAALEAQLASDHKVPIVRYVDPSRNFDGPAIVADMTVDHGRQTATLTVWG